ncbi:MAG: DUF4097 family beta strand repeat-containing protein [Thermoplasmatota archaeon]
MMMPNVKPLLILSVLMILIGGIWFAIFAGSGYLRIDSEKFEETVPAPGEGRLNIENSLGKVVVATHENEDIVINGKKSTLFGKRELDRIDVDISIEDDITISVDNDGIWWVWVDLEIFLPGDMDLISIEMLNGKVRMEGTSGDTHITSSNGDIEINDHTGNLTVESNNGWVRVRNLTGDIDIEVDNGDVDIDEIGGILDIRSDNGDIRAMDVNGIGRIECSNGDITASIDGIPDRGTIITADRGDVVMTIREEANMRIDLKTSLGDIRIRDLSVNYLTNRGDRKIGTLGNGGPTMIIDVDLGDITLKGVRS